MARVDCCAANSEHSLIQLCAAYLQLVCIQLSSLYHPDVTHVISYPRSFPLFRTASIEMLSGGPGNEAANAMLCTLLLQFFLIPFTLLSHLHPHRSCLCCEAIEGRLLCMFWLLVSKVIVTSLSSFCYKAIEGSFVVQVVVAVIKGGANSVAAH